MRLKTVAVFFLLFFTLFSFYNVVQINAYRPFSAQTIDRSAAGIGNGYCPIVVDSSNKPHIAYTGVTADSTGYMTYWVKYAVWNGTNWETQTVTEGMAYSLALNKEGNPDILYGHGSKGLMYANWNGYKWITYTVDESNADFGVLAFDKSGTLHIAYTDGTNIKYASGSGSNWNIQTVPTHEQGIIAYLSFQINVDNTPYIMCYSEGAYLDKSAGVNYRSLDVKLITNQNSEWKIENISLPQPVTYFGNMVLDSNGNPELIYTQSRWTSATDTTSINSLAYARWNGDTWETQTVVPNTDITYNYVMMTTGFLALDSKDQPYVCYISSTSGLTYASQINDDTWITQAVNASARWPCYMAIDANNNPHISYIATSGNIVDLAYATASTTTEPTPPAQTTTHIQNISITAETSFFLFVVGAIAVVVLIFGLFWWKKSK